MNEDIKNNWVKELRSGNYTQTTDVLKCENSFCCLGVLSDMFIKAFPDRAKWDDDMFINLETDRTADTSLPWMVREWSGVKDADGRIAGLTNEDELSVILANLNDQGDSFEQIADVIEEHWEKL